MSRRPLSGPPVHDAQFSYQWREWLRRLYIRAAEAGQILWSQVSKAGSNLTDIEIRRHRDLQDLQGGTTAEYYHLTSSHHTTLTGGGDADALHTHASGGQTIINKILLTPADDLVTDGLGNVLIGSA